MEISGRGEGPCSFEASGLLLEKAHSSKRVAGRKETRGPPSLGAQAQLCCSLSLPPCDLAVLGLLVQWSSPRSSKSLLYPVVFFFLVCLDQKIPLAQR